MSDVEPTRIRRRRPVLIAALATAGVLLAAGGLAVGLSVTGVDRGDDAAVARTFVARYAAGDPAMCELATPELREQLLDDGRCRGQATGQTPDVQVLFAQACGDDSQVGMRVRPPGKVGKPYVSLGLNRINDEWAVDSILPLSNRNTLGGPGQCTTQSSYDGGN